MKILIVDDSKFSQIVTSRLIKSFSNDLEITFADDGEEGVKKCKEIRPDYIFVDLLMPKLDGKKLIKIIKENDSNCKIFVITADVQKSVREEVEAYGIMGFINKPFNEEKAKFVWDIIKGDENE